MKKLAAFIRNHRDAIVARWLSQVSELPSAMGQPSAVLRDHIPTLLDELANTLDRGDANDGALDGVAGAHAALRYRAGYNLRQIVLEYQALRRTVLDMYSRADADAAVALAPLIAFDEGLDEAIGDAVDRYTDERDRARDVFVGILGHDLRNPLQSVVMGAEALLEKRDVLDPQGIVAVERMQRASRRMAAMIGDLLDFARGHLGGGIPIERTTIDLRALVVHAVEEIGAAHPDRAVESVTPEGDVRGDWDGSRIAQAISNLVGNAIQHGGDPVAVELIDEGESVRIEVRNGGVIAPDILPTMLQPFRSGRSGRGLGLGLYVVDEIARAHGGRVDIASDVELGTRIALVLPRGSSLPARPRRE